MDACPGIARSYTFVIAPLVGLPFEDNNGGALYAMCHGIFSKQPLPVTCLPVCTDTSEKVIHRNLGEAAHGTTSTTRFTLQSTSTMPDTIYQYPKGSFADRLTFFVVNTRIMRILVTHTEHYRPCIVSFTFFSSTFIIFFVDIRCSLFRAQRCIFTRVNKSPIASRDVCPPVSIPYGLLIRERYVSIIRKHSLEH